MATYDDLWLPLPGKHQLDNLALAVRGAERLFAREGLGFPDPVRVRQGISAVRWRGRLEWLPADGSRPRLLLDAAHNPSGAERLAEYLETLGANGRRVLVFGASRDKRVEEMLVPLAPHFQRVLLTAAATRRALPIGDLKESAERVFAGNGTRAETVEHVPEALARACRLAGRKGEVVIAGSIFLLGDALRLLRGEKAPSDDADVIEMPVLPTEPPGQTGAERRFLRRLTPQQPVDKVTRRSGPWVWPPRLSVGPRWEACFPGGVGTCAARSAARAGRRPAFRAVGVAAAVERGAEVGTLVSGWGGDVRSAERCACRSENGVPGRGCRRRG